VLVAVALFRLGVWVAPAWIALDGTPRTPAFRTTWRRLASLSALWRPILKGADL